MKKLNLTDGEYETLLGILFADREDAMQDAANEDLKVFRASAIEKMDRITKVIRVLLYHCDEQDA